MISIRKATARGLTHIDWLKSYHTFSFGDYYSPEHMGFSTLRVINEDRVQPGEGFGTHQHRDMEIISYVVSGGLAHKDSMGTGSIIKPGEIQRMSAGKGVSHSEFNASKQEIVHFLQIWIVPSKSGLEPSYEQKKIPTDKINELILIGSAKGGEHIITIHQEVSLYVAYLKKDNTINYRPQGKHVWVQLIKGKISVNQEQLEPGDGAQLANEDSLAINSSMDAEFLLFDLK